MTGPDYTADEEFVDEGRGQRLTVRRGGAPLSLAEVVRGWAADADFRGYFVSLLAASPFEAFFWEMPPLTTDGLRRPCELVLVDAPALAGTVADPGPFAGPQGRARDRVAAFPNLGGDALLIAPRPGEDTAACAHLAAFSRHGSTAGNHALWREVGHQVEARLGRRPLWVSTSGLGVLWLHVRLDSRPKYFTHAPYRQAPSPGG